MTKLFRMLILAALSAVVMASSPASSAGVTLFCENGADCPMGQFCSVRPGHKTGHCVGDIANRMLVCENNWDCPFGRSCSIRPGRTLGYCVGSPAASGFTPVSTAPVKLVCENSLDCPMGKHCKVRPGSKAGLCVAP